MNLHVNGESVQVPKTIETISELIDHYGFKNPVIIVEHNEVILDRKEHEQTKVLEGDQVEFVQFVGGG